MQARWRKRGQPGSEPVTGWPEVQEIQDRLAADSWTPSAREADLLRQQGLEIDHHEGDFFEVVFPNGKVRRYTVRDQYVFWEDQ